MKDHAWNGYAGAEGARKPLFRNLALTDESEERIKDIYKELFKVAQTTFEASIGEDRQNARQFMQNKMHFNGLVERARSNVYVRLKNEQTEDLAVYKMEISTIENFRRIHNLLRRLCKLILREDIEPKADPPATPA